MNLNHKSRPEGDLYSQIFEQRGQWLTGRYIASEIIRYQMNKAPIVEMDPRDDNSIVLKVPTPKVKNEVDGSYVPIDHMVPPELLSLYHERLTLAMQKWMELNPEAASMMNGYLEYPRTDYTLNMINAGLRVIETMSKNRGEKPEMWMITAEMFGFSRWNVPNLRLAG